MNVTSVSNSPVLSAARPNRPPSPEALFKQLDSSGKGYLTQSDFESAVAKISPEGAQRAAQDGAPSAADVFKKLDTNGDGQLTAAEFKAGAPKPPAGGPPPGGGRRGPEGAGGPPPGGGAAGGGSATTSKTSTDPADTNQDGTVSAQEALVYAAQQAASKPAASPLVFKQALQSYQNVSQLG